VSLRRVAYRICVLCVGGDGGRCTFGGLFLTSSGSSSAGLGLNFPTTPPSLFKSSFGGSMLRQAFGVAVSALQLCKKSRLPISYTQLLVSCSTRRRMQVCDRNMMRGNVSQLWPGSSTTMVHPSPLPDARQLVMPFPR
jgi:hypothetical protein